jgi:hypothetical protein
MNQTQNFSQTFGALEDSHLQPQKNTTHDAQISARDFINLQEDDESFHFENFPSETDEAPRLQKVKQIAVKPKLKEDDRSGSDLNIHNTNLERDLDLVRKNFQDR